LNCTENSPLNYRIAGLTPAQSGSGRLAAVGGVNLLHADTELVKQPTTGCLFHPES
jgi:hypothetical protein